MNDGLRITGLTMLLVGLGFYILHNQTPKEERITYRVRSEEDFKLIGNYYLVFVIIGIVLIVMSYLL